MTCPVCGTVTVPGARYCHQCGTGLPAAAPPAAERRVVTVLFGDLSDFTAWSEGVDPERVGVVTDRVLAALAGAVKTFGGHVDKLTGDGIMAVFGAPVAHEDDPERAVRAALAMQRAVRRVLDDERGGGAPTGLRIGINTGEVVAGVQAALEYTVLGDTVNTAARLADAAAVGSVYAGASTSTATRHLAAWRRLLPLRLKGKRQAVEAYELLGPLDAPGTRSGLGDEGPFVGRDAEIALVSSRLAEAIDRSEPRALVFTADAGLGKTRLAAESAALAGDTGRRTATAARVLTVRCAAYGERWRLGPLADLVRAAVGLPDQASPALTRPVAEERLRRVANLVHRHTGTQPRLHTDQLLALLGFGDMVGDGDGRPSTQRPGPDRAGAEAESAPIAVADLLSALASEEPLTVIVDDLHEASPQTVDALSATLSRLTGPVLVLLLGRPEMTRTAGALTRLADAEVRALAPLRGADTARLLTSYLNGGRLPTPDTDRLLRTAQGNPFYLAELVTMLLERGALMPDQGARDTDPVGPRTSAGAWWRLDPASMDGRLLSRDLAAVLAARIDALPAQARAVLRDAAVIGDTVPAAALDVIRHRTGAGARPAAVAAVDLARAVDELRHRRMLLPTRGGYLFATPLLREAAYAGVGKANLADKHARMVRWAADLSAPVQSLGWSEETLDGFIAEQAERAAGLADEVRLRPDAPVRTVAPIGASALARLAARAIRAGEPGRSADLAQRAARLRGGHLPPADRLIYGSALFQLGQTGAALAEAEKAGADAADDPASRARALVLAGRAYKALGDSDRGDQAWQAAVGVAEGPDLAAERAEVLRRMSMDDYLRGRLREAKQLSRQALAIAESSHDRRGEAWALQNLAWVLTTLGDFAGADATLARAARLFAQLNDPSGRAWMRGTTAFTRLLAGRLADARRLADAFVPFGERVGERWAVGTLRAVGAFAAAELGDLTVARREADRAYEEFTEIDDDWGRGLTLVVYGVIARGAGERERALELLSEACVFGESTGHPLLLGVARTIRGFAYLDLDDPAAAEAEAHAVAEVVQSLDVGDAARVGPQVLLGCARLARGDAAAAMAALAEAAEAETEPAVLLTRRHAVAIYAHALLLAGDLDGATQRAHQAVGLPAEDVRSQVVSARVLAQVLAAGGQVEQAREWAVTAVRMALSTEQVAERAASEAVLAELA